ncbi:MAG TPA: RNA 2',3'-cyclic phosphodiesterase [Natronosporangium sp.]
MRLFVALYPAEPALNHVAAAIAELRLGAAAAGGTNVRLIARPLWHVTLAFLGEVVDERGPAAAAAVRAGVDRWQAGGSAPPKLRLAGGGRFGRRQSTVVWVGLDGEVDGLRALAQAVRRELRKAKLPCDPKPFRPHLTLARPGERLPADDLAADLATLKGYEGPGWTADAVYLVRSQLGPKPVHERIAEVPLAAAPG